MIAKGLLKFIVAQAKHLAHGSPKCTEGEIEARLEVCQACEQFTGTACQICLCKCSDKPTLLNKLALADQACPLGKWPALWPRTGN